MVYNIVIFVYALFNKKLVYKKPGRAKILRNWRATSFQALEAGHLQIQEIEYARYMISV